MSGSNLIQVREFTNYQLPLHIVSSGLAIMAHWTTALIDRYLALTLEELTAASITDPTAIRDRLEQTHDVGFYWTREEFAEGISSVAAPVLDSTWEAA